MPLGMESWCMWHLNDDISHCNGHRQGCLLVTVSAFPWFGPPVGRPNGRRREDPADIVPVAHVLLVVVDVFLLNVVKVRTTTMHSGIDFF